MVSFWKTCLFQIWHLITKDWCWQIGIKLNSPWHYHNWAISSTKLSNVWSLNDSILFSRSCRWFVGHKITLIDFLSFARIKKGCFKRNYVNSHSKLVSVKVFFTHVSGLVKVQWFVKFIENRRFLGSYFEVPFSFTIIVKHLKLTESQDTT